MFLSSVMTRVPDVTLSAFSKRKKKFKLQVDILAKDLTEMQALSNCPELLGKIMYKCKYNCPNIYVWIQTFEKEGKERNIKEK